MADALVPVGRHFFTPDYIKELASELTPADAGPLGIAGKIGVDNEGATVAMLFSPKNGRMVLRTAYRYDLDEGHKIGMSGTFKF